jgi:hypothetical protein
LAAASSLLIVTFGPPAVATSVSEETHLEQRGQEHVGPRCTPEDIQVAGGTIVGVGGQVVAGGGGSGADCDTFYAYEVRTGKPEVAVPWAEPGIYINPGGAVSR